MIHSELGLSPRLKLEPLVDVGQHPGSNAGESAGFRVGKSAWLQDSDSARYKLTNLQCSECGNLQDSEQWNDLENPWDSCLLTSQNMQ